MKATVCKEKYKVIIVVMKMIIINNTKTAIIDALNNDQKEVEKCK